MLMLQVHLVDIIKHWDCLRYLMFFHVILSFPQANAASGMAVHDECKLKFLELKAKRTYRFIVYKIEEKQKQVIVEKVGEPTESYEDFAKCLPADECRYAVYDFDFLTAENVQKSRIFFIAWYCKFLYLLNYVYSWYFVVVFRTYYIVAL